MSTRPFTRADYLAIKTATHLACEDAGPLQAISEHTRVAPSLLSLYGNAERCEYIPLDVAMDLDALSGGDRILRAWASLRGYDLVRDEKGVAVESMNRHIAAVGIASAELTKEMCEANSDGKVTPVEAGRVERRKHELDDATDLVAADMRRIRAA